MIANNFQKLLESTKEIGTVDQIIHSVIYVRGLPGVRIGEIIYFENESIGQSIGINEDYVQVLFISGDQVSVGQKAARSTKMVEAQVSADLLGCHVDVFGKVISEKSISNVEMRAIDIEPPPLMNRKQVKKPLDTGVSVVDVIVPLAKGQRELVIGDKGTGKSSFLLQTIISQANNGVVCIYALIGKRSTDIDSVLRTLEKSGVADKSIVVSSRSSDPPGTIHFTPYTAMTIAEYFRDRGLDVLLVLDDLTAHAKNYREISLLAKKFPGRSSYPGDIFYIHAKLLERAGNFDKGSITCLPIADSVLGNLSDYIQTNLMAMTDGHIYFDIDLFDKGRRPAVNPFLSVTRVGHNTQRPLSRSMSREISSFLVKHDRMTQFMHFGAEIGEETRRILDMGDKIYAYFNQSPTTIIPNNINTLMLAGLWANIWAETEIAKMKNHMNMIISKYYSDKTYKESVDNLLEKHENFMDLVNYLKQDDQLIIQQNM